jgi:hypothetical protein
MHACIYIYICVCVCVCVYTHIHINANIYAMGSGSDPLRFFNLNVRLFCVSQADYARAILWLCSYACALNTLIPRVKALCHGANAS